MSDVRNPEWPLGITLARWLALELWREYPETGKCKSCGRWAVDASKGHDGFCAVPFLWAAQSRIGELKRAKADALMRYGQHASDCQVFQVGLLHAVPDDCSCGLWEAIGQAPYDVVQRSNQRRAALAQEKPE